MSSALLTSVLESRDAAITEVERLKAELADACTRHGYWETECLKARAERDGLVEALRWYADNENYHYDAIGASAPDGMDLVSEDCGKRAREALAKVEGK